MTLMRFDPFRELDRVAEQAAAGAARAPRAMPMEAFRRGDEFTVELDVPGVDPSDVDITVERNVVSIRASRRPRRQDDDELIVDERPTGELTRQLLLGDNLDTGKVDATIDRGVLTLTIPVAETSKPRRIQIAAQSTDAEGSESGRREKVGVSS